MDESFGSSLRRERELRFIELKEISQATMIGLRFLEAIENDDFDSLPHSTFVRGFLRAYAKYVGLNPDEVVTNYEHYLQSIKGEEAQEEPEGTIPAANYPKLGIWAGVLIALLVGGVLVYLSLRGEETPPISSPPEHEALSTVKEAPKVEPLTPITEEPLSVVTEDTPIAPAEKALPLTPPTGEALVEQALPVVLPSEEPPPAAVESPPTPAAAGEEIGSPPAETAAGKGVELMLKAVEESWVLFRLDDEPEVDIIMLADTTKTLKAQTKIVLTVGNAAGVELTLNGKPLPPLGEEGQVVRGLVFEAETKTEEEKREKKTEDEQNKAEPQG